MNKTCGRISQSPAGIFSAEVTSTLTMWWTWSHKQPKPSVSSSIWGNVSQANSLMMYLTLHSSNNRADPPGAQTQRAAETAGCWNTPALQHSHFCGASSPSSSVFCPCISIILPTMSWEIISIIPTVSLHHTEQNQSWQSTLRWLHCLLALKAEDPKLFIIIRELQRSVASMG